MVREMANILLHSICNLRHYHKNTRDVWCGDYMIENLDEVDEDISETEWLAMGLKAWLAEDKQMRMHVVTTTPKGKWVSLGWISKLLFFEDRAAADRAVNRIACKVNRRLV